MAGDLLLDIEDATGNRLAGGPIISRSFVGGAKLDRVGQFTFQVPAGMPTGRLCVPQNYVRVYALDDEIRYEVFHGIIKSARTSVESPDTLTVQGVCLLGELANRSVLELELVRRDEESPLPEGAFALGGTWVRGLDPPDDFRTDMPNARDNDPLTNHNIAHVSFTNNDRRHIIYIGQSQDFDTIVWEIVDVETWPCSPVVEYWDSNLTNWATVTLSEDTTVGAAHNGDGNASLRQSGEWHFTPPADWGQNQPVATAPLGYWLRIHFPGTPPNGEFSSHNNLRLEDIWTITTLPCPSDEVLADIMFYAPLGWDLDTDEGHATLTPGDGVFHYFSGESVLQALIRVAEITGEHFRLGIGRNVVWMRDETIDRGVYAIKPTPGHAYLRDA